MNQALNYTPVRQDRVAGLLLFLRRNPSLLGRSSVTILAVVQERFATKDLYFMARFFRLPSIVGERFGLLEVLSYDPPGKVKCKVRCDCGTVKTVWTGDLRSGKQQSCGCLMRAAGALARRTHGLSSSPEYVAWCAMKYRTEHHPEYLARGITVCAEWREDFKAFYLHIGPKPKGARYTVDRIRNEGHYEVGNVRWATYKEQNNNRRPRRWRRKPRAA